MLVRLVEVYDIGDGKDVGEGRVLFDEKALNETCAYFDSLKIHSGAVHCWYGEGADDVDGPYFAKTRSDAAADLSW